MKRLAPSLTRHSHQWLGAVLALAIADISTLLATFMPMKAILILASGAVPEFFPLFLVTNGPLTSSLLLLGFAALLALLSVALDYLVKRLDISASFDIGAKRVPPPNAAELHSQAHSQRKFEASLLITFVVIGVLVFFSPGYLGFSVVWIFISALIIAWLLRRSNHHAPFTSGADRLSNELAKWLRSSSLWSMVVLSVITLLATPPRFGATAILIAAVFGRRLLIAIADFLPTSTAMLLQPGSFPGRILMGRVMTNTPTSRRVRWPVEYFATETGARRLRQYLLDNRFSSEEFLLIGSPVGQGLSIVAHDECGRQFMFRIFGHDQSNARDKELQLRRSPSEHNVFPDVKIQETRILGYPSIILKTDSDKTRVDTSAKASRKDATKFQLTQEIASLVSFGKNHERGWLGPSVSEIVRELESASRIPGGHVSECRDLVPKVASIVKALDELRPTTIPTRALNQWDVYISTGGDICFLGGPEWEFGLPGDSWPLPRECESTLDQVVRELGEPLEINKSLILLNAEFKLLLRTLKAFQLWALPETIRAVDARLRELSSSNPE